MKTNMNIYPSDQTIKTIDKKVESYLNKNTNASLRTLYKNFRRVEAISLESDIILLSQLANLKYIGTNKLYNRRQINNAFKLTGDYNDLSRGIRGEIVSQLHRCQKSGNMLPETD